VGSTKRTPATLFDLQRSCKCQALADACKGCRFDPKKAEGPEACPFTTLSWDFLARHQKLLAKNQRMTMQLKNLSRKAASALAAGRRAGSRPHSADAL